MSLKLKTSSTTRTCSSGEERLHPKQRVGGSNPSTFTTQPVVESYSTQPWPKNSKRRFALSDPIRQCEMAIYKIRRSFIFFTQQFLFFVHPNDCV
jgi:hypothetical protein